MSSPQFWESGLLSPFIVPGNCEAKGQTTAGRLQLTAGSKRKPQSKCTGHKVIETNAKCSIRNPKLPKCLVQWSRQQWLKGAILTVRFASTVEFSHPHQQGVIFVEHVHIKRQVLHEHRRSPCRVQ